MRILPEVKAAYQRRKRYKVTQADVKKTSKLNLLTITRLENGRHINPKYFTVKNYVSGVDKAINIQIKKMLRYKNELS